MKGCLKYSPIPSPGLSEQPPSRCHHRKCVAFGAEGSEVVYTADEWDRTPTEPARKLTYQDLLELKEIQRSLPRANQPCDLLAGRPSRHYLSAVPIGLLPLLPDGEATDTDSGDGEGSSLAGSPMEGSRTGSPVPAHSHGNGYGFSPSFSSPLSAPLDADPPTSSPWKMNFHRPAAAPAGHCNSYFPVMPVGPAPNPARVRAGPPPPLASTFAQSSFYYSFSGTSASAPASPSPTSPALPAAPIPVSPQPQSHYLGAPGTLSPSLSSSSVSSASSTGSVSARTPGHLSYLSHLMPARPKAERVRPRFAFLPLLETPPSSVPSSVVSSAVPSRTGSPEPGDVASELEPVEEEEANPTTPPGSAHGRPAESGEHFPTPSPSEADTDDFAPSTPALTNASLDSPRSRASSIEPREDIMDTDARRTPVRTYAYHDEQTPAKGRARSVERFSRTGGLDARRRPASASRERPGHAMPPRGYASVGGSRQTSRERPIGESAQVSALAMFSGPRSVPILVAKPKPPPAAPVKKAKKRNFIVVNDMEIELDDDDDDGEEEEDAASAQGIGMGAPRGADTALSETGLETPRGSPERAWA